MTFKLPPDCFVKAAEPIIRKSIIGILETDAAYRRWMSCFGARPEVMAKLWTLIDPVDTMPNGAEPKHMTWAFYYMKQYPTEEVTAINVGGFDEKTTQKWIWLFIEAISYQEHKVIVWNERFLGDVGNDALTTIDGTDMPVQHRFDKKFYSHKFKSNGLRFEVGVCIQTGHIVWLNGPFCAGKNDITIAQQALIRALDEGEMVEADGGYAGEEHYIKVPKDAISREQSKMKQTARSRHESANSRLKIFQILKKEFRHKLMKHSSVFRAVAVITQLNIEDGYPLFSVEYIDLAENAS
eukprot:CCRYP_014185-RA/>CCRYP_014185-RA protein AED:0.05 eAED:0.05 QI:0/0/0/1/1/1/2/0/295